MQLRIGHGYDVHRLAAGRELVLGGVRIPFELGLAGHSDADVLTHAVMDALLGALALGDIGGLFPDTGAEFKDADSTQLLQRVVGIISGHGYSLVNLDATIVAERPKLSARIPEMRRKLAEALRTDIGAVSVKATTEEGLGFTGSGEGIAAHAVALLQK